MKGTEAVPFSFTLKPNLPPNSMTKELLIAELEEKVNELLLSRPGYFLVQVRIKPTNNIKVFIDGDEGVTIESCTKINRELYKQLEEEQRFPNEDYSLEVSSPGVGEPLLFNRQYKKNIGRHLEVKLEDGSTLEGELKAVSETDIDVEVVTGKGKKMVVTLNHIEFNTIKSAAVQVKF